MKSKIHTDSAEKICQGATADLFFTPCSELKGVGKKIAERLAHLGIHHIQDMLFHLPMRYQDRTRIVSIANLRPGDYAVIEGRIFSVSYPKAGRTRLLIVLHDKSARISLRFFHVHFVQRQQLCAGTILRCFGEIRRGQSGLEMIHPEYRIVENNTISPVEENLTPIYPTTEGLSQTTWRKLTDQALQRLKNEGSVHDIIPEKFLNVLKFPTLTEALLFVHRPPPDVSVDLLLEANHVSQKRLIFEELLAHHLNLYQIKKSFQKNSAYPFKQNSEMLPIFLKQLSFELTSAQKKAFSEIQQDLHRSFPMLRLLQGDVGSGKTVVAAMAVLQAVENNFQSALLAPTELLAEQHFNSFQKWFAPLNLKVVFLSGQIKTAERREALESIKNGTAQLIIGTHAIFQKSVEFSNLALLIVDEQHRFGVEQRALLREKGMQNNYCPHQLIMTATPIPRTLAMSVYADMDCSMIDELPPGRTPVSTSILSNSRRDEVLERIRQACASGKQAYWVCTLIQESEQLQCQAAEKTATLLKTILSDLNIALVHGRMKSDEKEKVMKAFKKGEINLLVATTVIEVGVDVPNASLMVIENAERLGLSQLHQLRGRVGRGKEISHCVLMYQGPLSSHAQERLSILRETTDGFKIAQRDLELRGPGEVLGTRQTGDVFMRIADLVRDKDLHPAVQQTAQQIISDHPHLIEILIKRWIGMGRQFGHV